MNTYTVFLSDTKQIIITATTAEVSQNGKFIYFVAGNYNIKAKFVVANILGYVRND